MALGFTGEYTQKVDGKGRMSVPADFRRVLEAGDPDWTTGLQAGLYLLYGDHLKETLHAYTVEEFRQTMADINAMPKGDPNKRALSHLIIGQSMRLDVDKDGRVVMPLKQREKLGIKEGELFFRGMGDHFEVWKAETFHATIGASLNDWLADKPDDFDPLSLLGT